MKKILKSIHHPSSIIHHPNKGFTLIELLVAATIIGLLSAIAVTSYTIVNRNSRDARRKADLEQIRAALEIYRSSEAAYPATANLSDLTSDGYIASIPTDPKDGTSYSYVSSSPYTSYCISAVLENPPASTDSCVAGGYNYAVSNP